MNKMLNDPELSKLVQKHIYECLETLLNKNNNFSILANLEFVEFEPNLPPNLISKSPVILFTLAGYTLSSAVLKQDHICFEAGFGADNFASLVKIPLGAIIQISVNEITLLVNFCLYQGRKDTANKSLQAFLSNPENRKLLNK